jgi:hypothetical protein
MEGGTDDGCGRWLPMVVKALPLVLILAAALEIGDAFVLAGVHDLPPGHAGPQDEAVLAGLAPAGDLAGLSTWLQALPFHALFLSVLTETGTLYRDARSTLPIVYTLATLSHLTLVPVAGRAQRGRPPAGVPESMSGRGSGR